MNNIKIIYDTMNDLPENIDGKYDIDMLPTTIIFQGKEYKAGVDIDNDEFYKLLRDNKEIPTTSQVTYMTFKETFEKYVKGIIHGRFIKRFRNLSKCNAC